MTRVGLGQEAAWRGTVTVSGRDLGFRGVRTRVGDTLASGGIASRHMKTVRKLSAIKGRYQ